MDDPFRRQNVYPYVESRDSQAHSILDMARQWAGIVRDDKASLPERSIDISTGVIKKIFVFFMIAAGFGCVILLALPLVRLVYEFSMWAYEKVGNIF